MAQDFNLLAKRPREFHLQNAIFLRAARPSLALAHTLYFNSACVLFTIARALARKQADEESISVKTHFWQGERLLLVCCFAEIVLLLALVNFWVIYWRADCKRRNPHFVAHISTMRLARFAFLLHSSVH